MKRHALIADGHHRYATYRELQRELRTSTGPGPWDRGLALLVDSTAYGPQVHAIHRVLVGLPLGDALERVQRVASITAVDSAEAGLAELYGDAGFAAVLTDGRTSAIVHDLDPALAAGLRIDDEPTELTDLDVTVLHRGLVERVWELHDNADTVGYAHSVNEAVSRGGPLRWHGRAVATHPDRSSGRDRGGGGPDAPQVHAVHAETGVRAGHAPVRRPGLTARRTVAASTSYRLAAVPAGVRQNRRRSAPVTSTTSPGTQRRAERRTVARVLAQSMLSTRTRAAAGSPGGRGTVRRKAHSSSPLGSVRTTGALATVPRRKT